MNYKAALPLALLVLAFTFPAAAREKTDCRTYKVTSVKMSAKSLKKAQQRARGAWERKTKRLSGLHNTAWGDWADAIEHDYNCYKKKNRHYCRAVARPCAKYGKRVAPEMRCQGKPITGDTAKAASVKAAKKEARGKWEKKAKANWGEARDHDYDCRKKGKHRWYCNGIARKCWKA